MSPMWSKHWGVNPIIHTYLLATGEQKETATACMFVTFCQVLSEVCSCGHGSYVCVSVCGLCVCVCVCVFRVEGGGWAFALCGGGVCGSSPQVERGVLSLSRTAGSRRVVLWSDPHTEAKWLRCLYREGGEGGGAVTCSEVVVMVRVMKLAVCVCVRERVCVCVCVCVCWGEVFGL